MAAQEIANCFALKLRITARQAIGGFLQDAFDTGCATIGLNRHLMMPLAFAEIENAPALSLLNSPGIEGPPHTQAIEAPPEPIDQQQVQVSVPHGVEVIVKRRD